MEESNGFINVAVPRQHVARVYEFIARLELGDERETPGNEPSKPPLTRSLVKRMLDESEPAHQDLLRYLADHPDEWLGTREIAQALGLPFGARSLAGSLGALGRRAGHRYGGQKPFESRWSAEDGQSLHRMSQEVSAWIKETAS
jgi:hypothetical protein